MLIFNPFYDMTRKFSILFLTWLISFASFSQQNFADKIYFNGTFYTCDSANLWAKAMAIRDDKIIYVGNDYASYKNASTQLIDVKQKLILPGFIDCHTHFLASGANLASVDLRYASSKREFIQLLKKYASSLPHDRWILGG